MNQETLEKEVAEYNEIIKQIQEKNQEVATLEQQRLVKLGRINLIQEVLITPNQTNQIEKVEKPKKVKELKND